MLTAEEANGEAGGASPPARNARQATAAKRKNPRAAALARLQAQREGRTLDSDDEDDDGNIYEYVDDEEYARRTRENATSDFVVDDDGRGYADDGRAWWEEEHRYSEGDESEAEDDRGGRPSKKAKGDKKGKGDKKTKAPPKQRSISTLFSGANKARSALAPTHVKKEEVVADSYLDDLLQELNQDDNAGGATADAWRKASEDMEDIALLGNTNVASKVFQEAAMQPSRRAPYAAAPVRAAAPARPPARSVAACHKEDPMSADEAAGAAEPMACDDDDAGMDMSTFAEHSDDAAAAADTTAEAKPEPPAQKPAAAPAPASAPAAAAAPDVPITRADAQNFSRYQVHDVGDDDLEEEAEAAAPAGMATDWWQIRAQTQTSSQQSDEADAADPKTQGESELPEIEKDGAKVLRMYWVDAVEDTFKHPGTVYLFGKVWNEATKQHESCCVTVNNIERALFFLPRENVTKNGHATDEEVTMKMVYDEVSAKMQKYNIQKWKAKSVERKYAFEMDDVPAKCDYLKVKYGYNFQQLPSQLTGETFSRVFGTNTPCLEHFILKRKLMGPCWLDIANFTKSAAKVTWCKWEVIVDNPKDVVKCPAPDLPVPTLKVASLSIKTVVNAQTHKHEIVSISVLTHDAVSMEGDTPRPESKYQGFTVIRQLNREPFPFDFASTTKQNHINIQMQSDERALLNLFLAKLHRFDPDVIVGQNFFGFDLDVMLHRMQHHKVAQWSKLGRLRRSQMPKLGSGGTGGDVSWAERSVLAGRLGVSMWITAKELITKVKSYSLQELARTQLGTEIQKLDFENIPKLYTSTKGLMELVRNSENETFVIMQLLFKLSVLPLSRQITCLAGNVWSRTLMGGRAERNEHLLLHEFHSRKYICPDKSKPGKAQAAEDDDDEPAPGQGQSKKARRKADYKGGLVLEPKKGFYDTYVLLLDFNSLYPSIIQEYNICFTTVDRKKGEGEDDGDGAIPDIPDNALEQGVLPRILATLVMRRKEIKNLIKNERDPVKLSEYDIRQRALKLTANSMYGCLGFAFSRFYAKPLAALVTSKGRDILENTANLARTSLNLDVIYGDTDSIMINTRSTDMTEVKKIGNQVKREVNKLYKLLEIDIDGVYKTMLLLKKKKYAALAVTEKDGQLVTEKETKGLDIVRRDWCGLSVDVGNAVLNLILADTNSELLVTQIHDLLRTVGEQVREGRVPRDKYVINKSLTKDPKDYPDKKSQPHVQVALRMRERGQVVSGKDTIPYVICALEDRPNIADRARHPDDLSRDPSLVIDTQYYLKQQLHPVVSRLCEPIQGTDARMIAECLGLDPAGYNARRHDSDDEETDTVAKSQLSDEEKYKDAAPWSVRCPHCHVETKYAGVVRGSAADASLECGMVCPNRSCGKPYPAAWLCNVLTLAVRDHIATYYKGWVRCDDPACGNRTRQLSVCGPNRCLVPYCTGRVKPEYTATMLYTQLSYYQFLFDRKHAVEVADPATKEPIERVTSPHAVGMDKVHAHVTSVVKKNARNYVDLASIFAMCAVSKKPTPA